MKNKRMVLTLIVGALVAAAVFGRDYNLNERESLDLSGVDEVVFNLNRVSCGLCIRTLDILSDLRGDGSGRDMALSLSGSISSNRDKAVPSLIIDESRKTVTVQLYPKRQTFFGLSQSGTAHFEAVLPASFDGIVTVSSSSDDIGVRSFDIAEMDVESSSGDLSADDIRGEKVNLEVSSGDIELNRIEAVDMNIKASSGRITIGDAAASEKLEVKASSGDITAGRITGNQVVLDTSSGKIKVDVLEAADAKIDVSSGNVQLGTAIADTLEIKLSTGDLEIDTLDSNRTEINTTGETVIKSGRGKMIIDGSSGDVNLALSTLDAPVNIDVSSGNITITLPEGSAFDVQLDTSSGRIRSEFPVLGDLTADNDELKGTVNGGGIPVTVKTSSGDIKLLVR